MASSTSSPSLDGLPVELIDFFLPDPSALTGDPAANNDRGWAHWTPLKSSHKYWPAEWKEALHTLRALSWTSQRLRAIVMPRLWAVIRLDTVEELGLLRDTLRSSKHLASFVRHLNFAWSMNNDYHKLNRYPDEHGTSLDMAFIDRGALWKRMQEDLGVPVQFYGEAEQAEPGDAFFTHNGVEYVEPGPQYEWRAEEEDPATLGLGIRSSGPDGKGLESRIKSPEDLISCLVEIVAQLPSIRIFRWSTAMPMPAGVFEALLEADQLTALHVTLAVSRKYHTNVPLWKLSSRVTDLSIAGGSHSHLAVQQANFGLASEEELLSVGLATLPSASLEDSQVALDNIGLRTITAAAKGGRLRRLALGSGEEANTLRKAFAVPSLLPCWVQIEEWGDHRFAAASWLGAAVILRRALFHASLRGAQVSSVPSKGMDKSRTLKGREVQAMHDHFRSFRLPLVRYDSYRASFRAHPQGDQMVAGTAPELYFSWLRNDAELAQQVADAWNEVVQRGDADRVKCHCVKCFNPSAHH